MWDAAKQLAAHKLKSFSSQLAFVSSQEQLRLTDLTSLDAQVATIVNAIWVQVLLPKRVF